MNKLQPPSDPQRPASRRDFEIAIMCALVHEADAVEALFDHYWDDDCPPYDKATGDPNAYSIGAIGRHNVVLAWMPAMGKASAAAVAANCRASFPNIRLALVVGVCGVVPINREGQEIILGDVIISDGVVQYDLGRRTLLDSLGRPNMEIRSLLTKLKGFRGRKTLQEKAARYLAVVQQEPGLAAQHPGVENDRVFHATYRHVTDGKLCNECGCNGILVPRSRFNGANPPSPVVHFGLVASSDTVLKSAEDRDATAQQEGVIAFEMESAGVWDIFPCVVIKGACDYADSHKMKAWQKYAAATAAAYMKAFLDSWAPSQLSLPGT
ncbi:kinesin light chain [Apiospora rasikravindrae]|uniref:Kinesin light chain n=1 Tax=Apiospora rasikravindrae TaxID=990691 RepID=A0ABR1RVL0_9PEZI